MYHIMIVEDDPLIAKAVGETLSSWGMEVHCVEDFSKCDGRIYIFRAPAGAAGHFSAFLQWISLVPGNPPGIEGTGDLPFVGVGQDEYYPGGQYGSG